TTATVCKAYSLRWQVELVFKSWKSDLHLATLPTKTREPTLCYLYGRLLLIVLTYALCPAVRTSLWTRAHREVSFLKLVRYLQALAESWLQHLFAPPFMLHAFLQQLCLKAIRVVTKVSRKRRTSAQRPREIRQTKPEPVVLKKNPAVYPFMPMAVTGVWLPPAVTLCSPSPVAGPVMLSGS